MTCLSWVLKPCVGAAREEERTETRTHTAKLGSGGVFKYIPKFIYLLGTEVGKERLLPGNSPEYLVIRL